MLEPHRRRLTWDFPIHSVDDVEALPFPPDCLNSKPSRFGSVKRLFDFYDYCAEHGIAVYGGGQFELGPGRGQIQHLASLFHAGCAERRGAEGVQRGRPEAGPASEPTPAGVRRAGFPLGVKHAEQRVEVDQLERLELRAAACAERERDLCHGRGIGGLEDVDEVVLAQRRPLVQHLRPELLDVLVHLAQPARVAFSVWTPWGVSVESIR